MKKYIIIVAVLISGMIFAQSKEPKLEVIGQLVKATYFYENGKMQQEGFFKDGKLDGVWTSFDVNGNKQSVGEYKNGQKTGKWLFWSGLSLSEVDYNNSAIAAVKTWKQDGGGLAVRN